MMASQRGKGTCPQCSEPYTNRYKPEKCTKCGYFLGGTATAPKRPRLAVPVCTTVYTGALNFYSCKTSTHDDRCLVIIGSSNNSIICGHAQCKQRRAIMVNSQCADKFTCPHIESVNSATQPLKTFATLVNLENYQCGDATRVKLLQVDDSAKDLPVAVQVSPKMYCVFGPPSTNAPAGYCHVQVNDHSVRCCSKDCKSFVAKAKQQKAKNICIHIHILISLGVLGSNMDNTPSSSSTEPAALPSSSCVPQLDNPQDELPKDTIGRKSTVELNMKRSLPYHIPIDILKQANLMDVSGWPHSISPTCSNCGLCGGELSDSRSHPGQRGRSLLITHLNPFKEINVLVRICKNQDCQCMHQVFPYEMGLFNVSDKVLVAFEILIEWRHLFRRGVPISTAIESKLRSLMERVQDHPTENEIDNIARLMYNGFYCFEAITERNLDNVICGICGTAGELYLGDGNEKNSCSNREVVYNALPESCNGPIPLDDFLCALKKRFVECTTYTRCSSDFRVNFATIPPIMAPAMGNSTQLNTEAKKKSTVLKSINDNISGDPALLHALVKDNKIDMSNIDQLDINIVKDVCTQCNIPTAQKSLQGMKIDLQCLFESMLVGNCPCHGFTKCNGTTGGFYHIVCRHGVTAASKFLTLQESVRDAADLYLSLKHPPPVFICDTACGFVRHMECRDLEKSRSLWGNYSGCFEVPTLGKVPSENVNIPGIVPSEYRDDSQSKCDDTPFAHPVNGSQRRYILGDRFHNSANPHKSPLCQFHDINLCLQGHVLKTSYQESENNRKNLRRLRSSCVQGFSTHFFYNFLMDFYQNEEIVRKQKNVAKSVLQSDQMLARDSLYRFVVVPKLSAE